MFYKTKDEVELDVYYLIYEFIKKEGLEGNVFLSDRRNESMTEDCVLNCTAITNYTCYQEGLININVYIPHVNFGGATLAKNTKRVIEVGNILKRVNDFLITKKGKMDLVREGYFFTENEAVHSFEVPQKSETLVNNRLSFKYYGSRI